MTQKHHAVLKVSIAGVFFFFFHIYFNDPLSACSRMDVYLFECVCVCVLSWPHANCRIYWISFLRHTIHSFNFSFYSTVQRAFKVKAVVCFGTALKCVCVSVCIASSVCGLPLELHPWQNKSSLYWVVKEDGRLNSGNVLCCYFSHKCAHLPLCMIITMLCAANLVFVVLHNTQLLMHQLWNSGLAFADVEIKIWLVVNTDVFFLLFI